MSIQEVNQKRTNLFQWLLLPKEQRFPSTYVEKAKELHVTTQTLINWEKKYFAEWKRQQKGGDGLNLTDLSDDDKIKLYDELQFQLALDPKRPSRERELFAKRMGLLIDKSETKVKIELTADDIARQHIENQRWLREHGYLEDTRVGQMQSKPELLHGEIREDT